MPPKVMADMVEPPIYDKEIFFMFEKRFRQKMTQCLIAGDGKPEPDGPSGFNSLLPTLLADISNIAPMGFCTDIHTHTVELLGFQSCVCVIIGSQYIGQSACSASGSLL